MTTTAKSSGAFTASSRNSDLESRLLFPSFLRSEGPRVIVRPSFLKDGLDEFGPVRGFDVPFDGVGDWDPFAIPPHDGEMTSLDTSLAQSGHQHIPTAPEPSVAEPNPEPEESQAGYDPMDVDLGVVPEEGPREEDPKEEPEEAPEEEPEDEPEEDQEVEPEEKPEGDLELEQEEQLEDEPKEEPDEESEEEEWIEVSLESGDEDNPIEIEADSESSKELVDQGVSDLDSGETESEWTSSSGRRG
ncbi:uncharacterized protein LOC130139269 [Syzygium oleosum]|uniref:uncharacterized protein LOC130139061 n=1 Tax=Syzygium oleosum TaxID=219896 RepID=UPI0024B9E40F|nr:uncharacterized protein LOC130139061 [Syzygium oleosum]XP_056171877.1 uncharacterized protein LOC130139269 [Syzygium oleosum]